MKCEPFGLILDTKEGMRRYFLNGLKSQEIYVVNALVSVLVLSGFLPFLVNVLDEFGLNFMCCIVFSFSSSGVSEFCDIFDFEF